jgi:3-deoxy-D-manno-oct-2-ulosonic acid (Kdo) hydroxylase
VNILEEVDAGDWQGPFAPAITAKSVEALESGKVLLARGLRFQLSEPEIRFLSQDYLEPKSKNVSYRPETGAVAGVRSQGAERESLVGFMRRFYACASALMNALCPFYRGRLSPGFTSFRPVEIAGRNTSWRKDDTRLHVDAFPSRPVGTMRILRLFTNVNPAAPRLWRVGERFEDAAKRFVPQVPSPLPGSGWLLHRLRVTKTPRTEYDHLMLGIHDRMKADLEYQQSCSQAHLSMAPGSTWACFTDLVPHAAMSGQFALEQTFYLPVDAMLNPIRSPLRILERLTGRKLA